MYAKLEVEAGRKKSARLQKLRFLLRQELQWKRTGGTGGGDGAGIVTPNMAVAAESPPRRKAPGDARILFALTEQGSHDNVCCQNFTAYFLPKELLMASRNQRRNHNKHANENVEILEKKRKSNPVMWVISIVILVVIIVTFIGAPLASNNSSSGNMVFGSYDGEEIVYYDGSFFSDQVNSIADNYRDQMTDANAYFIQFQVWRSAFDNTVYRTAAIKELKNSGVIVSSNSVDEAIVLYGPYMENGEFSENLYAQSSNTEKKYIRDRFEEDLYYSRFASDINSNPINLNEEKFLQEIASVEKTFRYTAFPFSSFPDDKVAEYGSENADLFRSIVLSKITVKSSEKDAEQIYEKLQDAPGMFTELAKTQSSDPYADKGGEMGSRYYYEMKNIINNDEALDEVFSLSTGEMSRIIEDDGSWVIYRCDKSPEYADMTLASDIAVVKDYMELYAKGVIEDYLVEEAENFAEFARSEGFTEAAADSALNVHNTNAFPIIYGNPSVYYYNQNIPVYTQPSVADDDSLNGASSNEYFLKTIDNLAMDEISEALILNDNVVIMQLVDSSEKSTDELQSVGGLISYAAQNWLGSQFEEFIYQSDKFEDNFAEVFSQIFSLN
ncbi:MAG: SurA N-terminal domain-containing protein [Spirochaetales bacterium]|uniref:Periplasmic chaperone PpiD n=1 Tax=Candidatus Thalassospirochaeta sargassi TaxID=3119039 RepID=A0AAJ1IGX6_9SPIO|nr:SurA N-terminal domain-containing protein [Spirochaetales bacterium]